MKRGAEKQISKDDADDEVEELSEPGQGFKKADEGILATRKIRALPKRSLAHAGSPAMSPSPSVSSTPEPAAAPTPVPKFSGFAGFGAGGSSSAPFSFSAPSPLGSPFSKPAGSAPPSEASSMLGSSSSASAKSSAPPSSSSPAVASSASAATKAFASFIGNSASWQSGPSKDAETADESIKAETKYLTALRGLNVSFLSAVSRAIEADPFLDVTDVLERYKALRVSLKGEYEDWLKNARKSPAESVRNGRSSDLGVESNAASAPSESQPKTEPSMPAPPSSYSKFPSFIPMSTSTSSSASGNGGGLWPKKDVSAFGKPTPLAFGATAPAAATSDKPNTELPKPAFSFAAPPASSSGFSSNPFAFGTSSSTSALSSNSTSTVFGSSSTPSAFSSSFFGKSAENAKPKENDKPSGAGPSTSDKSANFGFGSGSPTRPTFGGFGTTAGTIGNPVGFGFGSPPRGSDTDALAPAKPSVSVFAPSKPSNADADTEEKSTDVSVEGTPEPSQLLVPSASVHDLEGEGEEDEETMHEVRSKVYKLAKKQDGTQEWVDLGVGMLRLKKHKTTATRRLLLRNSSTGKITLNFNLYEGMSPSALKNTVSFIGHDHGVSTPFRLKVKTDAQATELKSAISRELDAV